MHACMHACMHAYNTIQYNTIQYNTIQYILSSKSLISYWTMCKGLSYKLIHLRVEITFCCKLRISFTLFLLHSSTYNEFSFSYTHKTHSNDSHSLDALMWSFLLSWYSGILFIPWKCYSPLANNCWVNHRKISWLLCTTGKKWWQCPQVRAKGTIISIAMSTLTGVWPDTSGLWELFPHCIVTGCCRD